MKPPDAGRAVPVVRLPRPRSAWLRLRWFLADLANRRQVKRIERYLRSFPANGDGRAVLFFNASTRINRPSLNAGFSLLASWALRASGVPVRHVVCTRGLLPCILGTNRNDYTAMPPCAGCLRLSRDLFPGDLTIPLEYDPHAAGRARVGLHGLGLSELEAWEHDGLPLGRLTLPGLRWALRRHHLPDDEPTRELYRRYLCSAVSMVQQFDRILDREKPVALVVFNGIMYPEAVARELALRHGLRVITHEVGLRPFSAFFSHEHATFREIELPGDQELTEAEERRLDEYLAERFRGRFTMAGIRFWPGMEPLSDALLERIHRHKQMVVIFTNVVFDTSQVHANTLYPEMFAWLEDIRQAIAENPDTFFIVRAHPDEDRPGKESRETVADWMRDKGLLGWENVAFFGPSDYVSSYELIQRAKLVLVYNSSIGLEASILGKPVLCAGRARYTQVPTVVFPGSQEAYRAQLRDWLAAPSITVPAEFAENARRFLYYELFHASLDLSLFLGPYPRQPGMVVFRSFDPSLLGASRELSRIREGILSGSAFVMP